MLNYTRRTFCRYCYGEVDFMGVNTNISSSLEDYLEAIADLIDANGHAHSKELAERLQVKMPSVTNALQALAARDLIVYRSHQPVVLTAEGAQTAAIIRKRHQGLCRFFEDVLLLAHDEADATACKVEHDIDENLLNKLIALTDLLISDPAAEELRQKLDGVLAELPGDAPAADLVALNELEDGQSGTIAYISVSLKGTKKFADMGLVPGAVLTLEGRAPLGDLLRIRVLDSVISLRGSDGAFILLKNVQ